MNLNQSTLWKIRGLIFFTIILFLGIQHIDTVGSVLFLFLKLILPFLIGACMAFIINVPMCAIERILFTSRLEKMKDKRKRIVQKIKRPVSIVITLLLIFAVFNLVIFTVVPELAQTISALSKSLPAYMQNLVAYLEGVFAEYPEIVNNISALEIDSQKLMTGISSFLQSGLMSTLNVAMGIASGVMNFFIGLIFAIYILSKKEKLGKQADLILQAFCSAKIRENVEKIGSLTYKTFANFLSGQCIEAIILGMMFFITMSLFKFPYAMLIGVLIAFTALIPIFGAFIGCAVGIFLILMISPIQAVYFAILFIVLQQVEGNLIYPYVVGNSVGLPSIWVLVAVTIGGSTMGVVGMLIFIPLSSVLYVIFRGFVYKRIEIKKERGELL